MALDAGVISHVQAHHVGGAAISLDFGAQLLEAIGRARGQHHLGAGACQGLGKACTEAAGGAGNQGDLALEIDFYAHTLLLFCFKQHLMPAPVNQTSSRRLQLG